MSTSTYVPGKRVLQEQYGSGTILDSNEYHTAIDFDDHGVRKFVTGMVELKASSVPAPAKPKRKTRKKASEK